MWTSYVNFPSLLLLSYTIRTLITGASIGESIAFAALCGLYGFHYYIEVKKEPLINEKVKQELKETREEITQIKSAMNSLKLGVGFNVRR